MRFHRRYPFLQCWAGIPQARERVRVQHLAFARFEPSMSYMRPSGMLDVVFCDGEAVTVIPFADVVVEMLQERERTPIVWPAAVEDLAPHLAQIEAALLPWLQSLTLARQLNSETVRRFSDVISGEEFDRARSARFLGAASYTDVLPALAPYAYAMRFDGAVALRDRYGASGGAVLAATGARVDALLEDRATEVFASKWFARDIYGEAPAGRYGVAIGPAAWDVESAARISVDSADSADLTVRVATPAPADVMISFDREDSPPIFEFGVRATETPLRAAPEYAIAAPAGGSSGKILLLLRDGFEAKPNADSDEACALASRLRAEGFEAHLVTPSTAGEGAHADLIHAFGMDDAVAQTLSRFKQRGTPTVLTPAAVPRGTEGAWGTEIVHILFTGLRDEASLEEQLGMFERRLLQTDSPSIDPLAGACAAAHVVLARSAGEELRLRETLGPAKAVVRADGHLGEEPAAPVPLGACVGTRPFIFAHAPVTWESNLVLLARVAYALGIPLVVAGPSADLDAVITARAVAPGLFIHLQAPSEGHLETLYRTARVYADVSWRSHGAHRVRRAATSGCALLLSGLGGGADFLPQPDLADPASESSLTQALQRVWTTSAATAPYVPVDAFGGIIAAYAAALQQAAPA